MPFCSNIFQLSVDPASDDSQIDDAVDVLKSACVVGDIRERLLELVGFLFRVDVAPKQKVIPAFVVAAFPALLEGNATSDIDVTDQLKSAVINGSFPVNLMSDVVKMFYLLSSFSVFH